VQRGRNVAEGCTIGRFRLSIVELDGILVFKAASAGTRGELRAWDAQRTKAGRLAGRQDAGMGSARRAVSLLLTRAAREWKNNGGLARGRQAKCADC
jgi:hypothetical protein